MSEPFALALVLLAVLGIAVTAPWLAVLLWRALVNGSRGRSGSPLQQNAGSSGDGIPAEPSGDSRNPPSVIAAPSAERRSTRASA